MPKTVLLFSGGLDSWVAYKWLMGRVGAVHPIYVLLGHRYERQELASLSYLAQWHQGPSVKLITGPYLAKHEQEDANIPFRNGLLATLAALELGGQSGRICLVAQYGEQSIPDRSPAFFDQCSSLLTLLAGQSVVVDPVFPTMTKTEMVLWYLSHGGSAEALKACFSCYADTVGSTPPIAGCGVCGACFRKWVCLTNAGVGDLGSCFLKNPGVGATASMYRQKAERGDYVDRRAAEILSALNQKAL